MNIKIDTLHSSIVIDFLEQHIEDMKSVSPPESKHALDLDGLKKPNITFWTIWNDDKLVGCGALAKLDETQGEIKSMRVAPSARAKGVATAMLKHILDEAAKVGLDRVSLETGSMPFFRPAHMLYKKFGFKECKPFADYRQDPNSIFMSKSI